MAGALAWAVQAFCGRLEWRLENPFWDKRDIFEKERLEALVLPKGEQGTKEGIHILFDRAQVIFFRVREEEFSD